MPTRNADLPPLDLLRGYELRPALKAYEGCDGWPSQSAPSAGRSSNWNSLGVLLFERLPRWRSPRLAP